MSHSITRSRNENGATMVEGAIVSTLVFFLIFMVVQSAFLGRTYLAARDAASAGARTGAVGADNADADWDILQAVNKSLSSVSKSDIQAIVVFNPQGTNFAMPAGCTTAAVTGQCNFYTAADLSRPITDFQSGATFTGPGSWPATTRSTSISAGLSHVGVYVKLNVGGIKSPLPASISKTAVVELEPHS